MIFQILTSSVCKEDYFTYAEYEPQPHIDIIISRLFENNREIVQIWVNNVCPVLILTDNIFIIVGDSKVLKTLFVNLQTIH